MTKVINTTDPQVRARLDAIPLWFTLEIAGGGRSSFAAARTLAEFRRTLHILFAQFVADDPSVGLRPCIRITVDGHPSRTVHTIRINDRNAVVSADTPQDETLCNRYWEAMWQARGKLLHDLPSSEVARLARL